jgi:lysophospholipase L1-like esterase
MNTRLFRNIGCLWPALMLAGCVHQNAQLRTLPAGADYVAMGSSYAAGAGIGPKQEGSPPRCDRSINNYASSLAKAAGLALKDVSCGGATTAHILAPWNELPAQIDAVTRATRLVTITIGGNDLGYVGTLFNGSCLAGVTGFPGPCRSVPRPTEADYRKLEAALTQIANEVHHRAPGARVIFVQYVTLLGSKTCPKATIAPEEAKAAGMIASRLAEVTRHAAQTGGAELLPTDIMSQDHAVCADEPWSNGFFPNYPQAIGAPWHPNAAGHAAIARLLLKSIGQP